MTERRTVNLEIDADTLTSIQGITGNPELFRALGYFTQWGMAYGHLDLIGGVYGGIPEFVATYRDEERGPIKYQICAVWHRDHFGFHS